MVFIITKTFDEIVYILHLKYISSSFQVFEVPPGVSGTSEKKNIFTTIYNSKHWWN